MDMKSFANGFWAMTCVVSVEYFNDGTRGKFRIVDGNDAYKASIEQPVPGAEMLVRTFVPNSEYTAYLTRDLNFEAYCFRAAVEKKCLHSYARPERMNGLWFNMTFLPVAYEEEIEGGRLCFCTYTMEINQVSDSKNMSSVSSEVATSVLETCIKLRSAKDFTISIKEVINDIGELCESEHTCILLMDHANRDCSVLCEAFSKDTKLLPMENYVDKAFYDIADSWKGVIAGSNCLIAKDAQDMAVVKERNPIWYESLTSAGAKNIVLFPLNFGEEHLGYIWAINFATENATRIKETLETTTFILSSEIYNHLLVDRLRELSSVDMLTGVMNRNEMNNFIDALREEQGEMEGSIGIIFADLNGLKRVNDRDGHQAGDMILKNAANILRNIFDVSEVFRAGGDEFTIISAGLTEEELNEKTEEIRKAAEGYENVSFALGNCLADGETDILTALRLADERMYEDKRLYYERMEPDQDPR